MTENFLKAVKIILEWEGITLENVKGDTGGLTFCGISKVYHPDFKGWKYIDGSRVNDKNYIKVLINNKDLMNLVYEYYYNQYWVKYSLENFPYCVSFEIFDQCINMGTGGCFKGVQRVLNACNVNNKYGDDLVVDGAYGKNTRNRLTAVLANVKAETIAKALNAYQGNYYLSITEGSDRKKVNRKFYIGWLNRVNIQ